MATNNVFINQLMQERGTTMPNLDYLGFGEPTTYGTSYLYSEEVVKHLKTERVKKGTMNKGSAGMMAAPWGENLVPLKGPLISTYGDSFQKAEKPNESEFNAEVLKARNKALQDRQREEARTRREQMFTTDKQRFDEMMSHERAKYANAQKAFDDRTSRVFSHKGINIRSKLTDAEIFAQQMAKAQEKEDRIRELVPRHTAKTPQPTLGMLKELSEGRGLAARAKSAMEALNNTANNNNNNNPNNTSVQQQDGDNINTSGVNISVNPSDVSGAGGAIDTTSQHVYPSDKQRIRFLMLENQRRQEGQKELAEHGWAGQTTPAGVDKKPYHPEDDIKGLDAASKQRIRVALEDHKQLLQRKRDAFNAKKVMEEEAFRRQLQEMEHLSKQPGVQRNTKKQYAEIMETLLNNPTKQIVVPRNLGIVPPATEEEIKARAQQVAAMSPNGPTGTGHSGGVGAAMGAYKTSVNGMVPIVGKPLVLNGANYQTVLNGGNNNDDDEHEGGGEYGSFNDTTPGGGGDGTHPHPAGYNSKQKSAADRHYNIISNVEDVIVDVGPSPTSNANNNNGGIITSSATTFGNTNNPNQQSTSSSREPTNQDGGVNPRPMRRTIHTHMPLPISQRKPHDPTRKDIDRELKTVVYGGHLLKDRSASIKALGAERISYIKGMNLGNNGSGNNTTAATAVTNNSRSYASISSGGGGARTAKPMVPPTSLGKPSLALL